MNQFNHDVLQVLVQKLASTCALTKDPNTMMEPNYPDPLSYVGDKLKKRPPATSPDAEPVEPTKPNIPPNNLND